MLRGDAGVVYTRIEQYQPSCRRQNTSRRGGGGRGRPHLLLTLFRHLITHHASLSRRSIVGGKAAVLKSAWDFYPIFLGEKKRNVRFSKVRASYISICCIGSLLLHAFRELGFCPDARDGGGSPTCPFFLGLLTFIINSYRTTRLVLGRYY